MTNRCFTVTSVTNRRIQTVLRHWQGELTEFFGVPTPTPNVFLLRSRKEFDALAHPEGASHQWMVGRADGHSIFILDPQAYTKHSNHTDPKKFWLTLKHEYVHIAMRHWCGHQRPKWLSEGLACTLADQIKNVPPKQILLKLPRYWNTEDSDLYRVGTFWTKFLLQRRGKKRLLTFLRSLGYFTPPAHYQAAFKKFAGVPCTRAGLSLLLDL